VQDPRPTALYQAALNKLAPERVALPAPGVAPLLVTRSSMMRRAAEVAQALADGQRFQVAFVLTQLSPATVFVHG
jgi:hypothetical protein